MSSHWQNNLIVVIALLFKPQEIGSHNPNLGPFHHSVVETTFVFDISIGFRDLGLIRNGISTLDPSQISMMDVSNTAH